MGVLCNVRATRTDEMVVRPASARRRRIRVLLVERAGLLRGALAAVFSAEDDLEIAATLDTLDGAPAAASRERAELAVLGVDGSEASTPETVSRLREQAPDCAIVVLTTRRGADRLRRALAGRPVPEQIRALIDTDTTPGQLVRYLRRVAGGERVMDPRLLGRLSNRSSPLTRREREVLELAALGTPRAEIAAKLHLSVGTVRNYLYTIVRKTGARSVADAVRVAERSGWL
jgi:two-component system, NarL family, response regulator DesR